jgi:hypothetical protein
MVALAAADLISRRRRAGRASRARLLRAVGTLRHAVMIAAMLPCLVGGDTAVHAGAAVALFALAVAHAPRSRRDPRGLPVVLDALAMAVLSVAAMLCGDALSGHAHAGGGAIGTATILAVLTVAGWTGFRLAARPDGSRLDVGLVAAAGMIVGMAAMTLLHTL